MLAHLSADRQRLLILMLIFGVSAMSLCAVYYSFPRLESEERASVKLPRKMDDAQRLGSVLSRYTRNHFGAVFGAIVVTYIFLQSFAIPGSIFLSILSGYLFPFPLALLLVCSCSAIGAAICYLLSYFIGRDLVARLFPERVHQWQMQVAKHRDHLINYILFLRITPFLPNWFINIASPVIDVPLRPFFWGTFFGVAAPSVVFIQTGTTLNQLTDSSSTFSMRSVCLLGALAVASLLPVFFRHRLRSKLE